MNILVVGGAGYIGSHTAKYLYQQGHNPVVFDNLDRGHKWACKWGEFVEGDLAEKEATVKALRDYEIDAVVHFAAHALVGESMEKPGLYFRNNVINALNLLEAMQEVGVTTIVFSSTCATYGEPQSETLSEEHPQQPVNPYGESKLMVEKALKWYGICHGLKWMALRYFNAAGADPEGEIGEDHDPESHLIPLVLKAALGERENISIFGTDYPTPDGTAIRDYIHIVDLADAHLKAIEYLNEGGVSQGLNLGTGKGFSVKEVVEMVEKVTERKVPTVLAERRSGDPAQLIAGSNKAEQILGWKPNLSSLEQIISTAWNWHQKQHLDR